MVIVKHETVGDILAVLADSLVLYCHVTLEYRTRNYMIVDCVLLPSTVDTHTRRND